MTSIHYKTLGTGDPLIFLHGFCETHEIWEPFIQPLSESFQVFLADLPGFGNSPLPKQPSIEIIAETVWIWLDQMKLTKKPIVIGHSLGGYVAMAMHTLRPSAMRATGLFHSTPLPDSSEKKKERENTHRFISEQGMEEFANNFSKKLFYDKKKDFLEKMKMIISKSDKETVLDYLFVMRDRPSYTSVLDQVPTLVIAGEEDTLLPIDVITTCVQKTTKGKLTIIPQVGHMGMWEAPQICQKVIVLFISNLENKV